MRIIVSACGTTFLSTMSESRILAYESLATHLQASPPVTPETSRRGTRLRPIPCGSAPECAHTVNVVPDSEPAHLDDPLLIIDISRSSDTSSPIVQKPPKLKLLDSPDKDHGDEDQEKEEDERQGLDIDGLQRDYEDGCPLCLRTWDS
jgi:hypothetical protein